MRDLIGNAVLAQSADCVSAGHRLSDDEVLYYLDTRKVQGFNAIMTVVLSELECVLARSAAYNLADTLVAVRLANRTARATASSCPTRQALLMTRQSPTRPTSGTSTGSSSRLTSEGS